ncbi:MAG: HEAT repeat domain-containing protein [candidate division Zixibacteria bacterium]|nr:HEAT repeat domain-containing protein [candidate division Zixibacteria bacterium]
MKKTILLTVGLILLLTVVSLAGNYDSQKETEFFLKAKEYVFERNWEKAQARLEDYLKRYRSGRFEEEALYWLARSMNQLSREVKEADAMVRLKEKAIENLDILLEGHPKSVWKDDAIALRVEIAATLALLGQEKYKRYIEEIVKSHEKEQSEILMIALEALAEMEPEVALPMIEDVLTKQKDPMVRKQAVFLIGAYHGEEGLSILKKVEVTDQDKAVREEAAYWGKRIQTALIPVQLNYYGYIARIDKEKDYHLLPEGKLSVFEFPALRSHSSKEIEKEVQKLFEGKLSDVKFATSAIGGIDIPQISGGRIQRSQMQLSHNLRGFRIEVPGDDIEKGYFQVRGKVSFFDTYRDREHLKDFVVNENHGQLMAMRNGEDVAILVLQFKSLEEPLDFSGEPVYYTKFTNVFGAVVHSSRQTWSTEEMSGVKKGSVVDYSRAKAEIPGKGGKWVLVGDIQLHGKERRFIGRDAVLYNPKHKVVAEASEIIVPANDPASFKVAGKE